MSPTISVLRWRGRSTWSWLALWTQRARPIVLTEPVSVTNDRAGGGVRCQDGVAAVAVQVLGKRHRPTLLTGATAASTDNTVDVVGLLPLLRQSLGLSIESLSVISTGARRRSTGDYARVYDTLIGTPPYAGQRETWLVARIALLNNADALQWRRSAGTAALAAAQRISAALRQRGVRARVATAADIVERERRLAGTALDAENRKWRSVRGATGWLTTYGYRPGDITTDALAEAWSLRADAITQNVTLFPDGTATAAVTVCSAQPPVSPPSVKLQPLPGEQAAALVAGLCGPRPDLRGVGRGPLPSALLLPIGSSGVLLGKVGPGHRLLLPLDDPAEHTRVHIAADDALAKRIVLRLAGAGERITVHASDSGRWSRMADVVVTDESRPASGTTISVVDGMSVPSPRPHTVISIGDPATPQPRTADVMIAQTGPASLEVACAGQTHVVEMELFRAENRYVSPAASVSKMPRLFELEPVT